MPKYIEVTPNTLIHTPFTASLVQGAIVDLVRYDNGCAYENGTTARDALVNLDDTLATIATEVFAARAEIAEALKDTDANHL